MLSIVFRLFVEIHNLRFQALQWESSFCLFRDLNTISNFPPLKIVVSSPLIALEVRIQKRSLRYLLPLSSPLAERSEWSLVIPLDWETCWSGVEVKCLEKIFNVSIQKRIFDELWGSYANNWKYVTLLNYCFAPLRIAVIILMRWICIYSVSVTIENEIKPNISVNTFSNGKKKFDCARREISQSINQA